VGARKDDITGNQRDIPLCLAELLDTQLSSGWVNGQLAQREALASGVNQQWQPNVAETLSGDEIYSNGSPNLVVVGNTSLCIYALTCQPTCDGDTWGCLLLDSPPMAQFASDGGWVWQQVRKLRGSPSTSWIGITCCARCGVRPLVWNDKSMPRLRPWRHAPPNFTI